ncbi:hypothetical protein DESC_770073 [Desulfosarcina cetonica]|nr:hypothetical protein DESC_770073 [Desulfosarcina cetonica]
MGAAGAFQAAFDMFHQEGARQTDDEVDDQDGKPDLKGEKGGRHQFGALEGEFLNGDHRDDGRVLDRRDELAGQGRHDSTEGLGKDDVAQLLAAAESQARGGLPLALVDGLDAGTNDFGDVGALVGRQGQDAGNEDRGPRGGRHEKTQGAGHGHVRTHVAGADAEGRQEPVADEVIENEDPHQDRDVADQSDIPPADHAPVATAAGAQKAHEGSHDKGQQHGPNGKPQGDQQSLEDQAGNPVAALRIKTQQILGHGLPVPMIVGGEKRLVKQPRPHRTDAAEQDQVGGGGFYTFRDHLSWDSQSLVSNQ